jgi:hypothetical protein
MGIEPKRCVTPVKSRGGALVAKNFQIALKLLPDTTINITKVL